MKDTAFSHWYDTMFGNVLGAEDDENRNAVRKIWNGVIEHVAQSVEFNNFEPISAEEIAARIRMMKERA
jgi:hypothetical protein